VQRLVALQFGAKATALHDSTRLRSHRSHESAMRQSSAAFIFGGRQHWEIPLTIMTERRSFIQGAGLLATAATTTLAASPAFAQRLSVAV
jgi:hypothetical protein